MSYTLADITLPNPQTWERKQIQVQKSVNTISGSTRRDVTRKKEQFILGFQKLSQAEVAPIIAQYDKNTALDFAVSETNLTIATTSVLVDLKTRRYLTKGDQYREDITLILTEV